METALSAIRPMGGAGAGIQLEDHTNSAALNCLCCSEHQACRHFAFACFGP